MAVKVVKTRNIMREKSFFGAVSFLFAIVFVVHLLRAINGWDWIIGGWSAPMWLSWVAIIVVGYLGWAAFRMRKGK